MDALEFAKEIKRMCDSNPHTCTTCDLHVDDDTYCRTINLEKAVPIVEKWSAEHPLVRNVDHVAEGLEKLGFRVDKEYISNHRCPPKFEEIFMEKHDAKVRAEVIDEFAQMLINPSNYERFDFDDCLTDSGKANDFFKYVFAMAEQLKEKEND